MGLKGKMNLGALDATQHGSTAQEYDGGRTADAIVKWAEEKFAENIPPPEVVEAVSNEVVAEACEKHPLCVMSFLPHILDCDAACRSWARSIRRRTGDGSGLRLWLSPSLRRRLMLV